MIFAIFVGSVMIVGSLSVSILMFSAAARMLAWLEAKDVFGYQRHAFVIDIAVAVTWILLALTTSVWGWAALYMLLGLFDHLEPALYFSIVSFTTVGYGDVVLEPGVRLLAGMTATHGLLTFGLFTAFLVEVFNFPVRTHRP